ncbi:MAG TPA: hypothetical protein VMJ73_11980 [Rhizomicrobium sp.]|nr:hypothetical protein [Rhizomicrobium sp.]
MEDAEQTLWPPIARRRRMPPLFWVWLAIVAAFGLSGAYVAGSCLLTSVC